MSKFVPCPLHSGTLVWTPSQSAPHANRAYSCGSGGRGPPSMNPCDSVNHQFSATISKISLPPPSPVESGNSCSQGSKTFLRRIADDPCWSLCAAQWKNLFRHMICPKEPSFPSKWLKYGHSTIPFHHSIPVEHSTDSIPPLQCSLLAGFKQGFNCACTLLVDL